MVAAAVVPRTHKFNGLRVKRSPAATLNRKRYFAHCQTGAGPAFADLRLLSLDRWVA
jgi:hypothetical protein